MVGLGHGVIGVVAKPVVGTLDAVTHASEGFKAVAMVRLGVGKIEERGESEKGGLDTQRPRVQSCVLYLTLTCLCAAFVCA